MHWRTAYQAGIITFGDIFLVTLLLALLGGIIWCGFRFKLGLRFIVVPVMFSFPLWILVANWSSAISLKDEFDAGSNVEVIEGVMTNHQFTEINGTQGVQFELANIVLKIERGARFGCFSPLEFDYKDGSFLRLHILWKDHPSEKVKELYPCIVKVEHWVCHPPPFEDYTHNCKKETWPQLRQTNNSRN